MNMLDWMQLDTVSADDKMRRITLIEEFLGYRQLRLLVCEFASDALALGDKPNRHSVEAIAVARKYANGEAADWELEVAGAAAHKAIGTVWKVYYTENPDRRAYEEFAAESAAYAATSHPNFVREHAWSAAYTACMAKWLLEPTGQLTPAHYQWQVERVIEVLANGYETKMEIIE